MTEAEAKVLQSMIKKAVAEASHAAIKQACSRTIIAEVVRQELSNHSNYCRVTLTPEQLKETSHLIGMLGDIGDGDISKGVELTRDNHKWVSDMRSRSAKVGDCVFKLFFGAISTGLLAALWYGIKHHLLGK